MAIAESTHWYAIDGSPQYTVMGKNGKERNTTLRDARQMNLVPSVTSILGVAAKPGLENWKINQALMAALTLPKTDDESLDDFMARAKQDAKEQAIKAAERGTQVHANIEAGFGGVIETTAYLAVRAILDERFPGEQWVAEDSFCSPHGYGGKIDLYSQSGIFVDFKTKDALDTSKPERLVYDEHGMQLSAYAEGMGVPDPVRVSIFVDRDDQRVAACHVWETESHPKHRDMFLCLLKYWQLARGYAPEVPNV
jgi:hypothetical protein